MDEAVLVVAEIGLNHNGDFNLAQDSVIAAAESGCDAVKFQNFVTEDFIRDKTKLFTYRSRGEEITEPFYDVCKRSEFKREWFQPLKKLCEDCGVELISTPTSYQGIEDLMDVGCKYIKNGSDYLTHLELLNEMGNTGMKVILSTGMADIEDIDCATRALGEAFPSNTIILHCTSIYPTEPEDVNLARMVSLKARYGTKVGFSDHTIGEKAAAQAVALGASVVEKHFTLSKDLPGPDHWFSSTPQEMKQLVAAIREAQVIHGSAEISPAKGELPNIENFRIGVVAELDLVPGHILRREDFAFRKPCSGILPREINKFIGRRVVRAIKKDEPLQARDFK